MVEEQISEHLSPLLWLQLSIARRAGDMGNFQFGRIRPVERGTVGDFALHIQCSWRLDGPTGVVTGRADLWEPAEESEDFSCSTWDYETGDNLQDIGALLEGYDLRTKSFINTTTHLIVETIQADAYEGAIWGLSAGYTFTLFPDGSRDEAWRLFRRFDTDQLRGTNLTIR